MQMEMAFRFPFPVNDPRVHREEELTLARVASQQRSSRPSPLDTPLALDPRKEASTEPATPSPLPTSKKKWVFADPVAYRYLESDPAVTVIERRSVLQGYELYLVEQWACSRKSPTLVIVTYTGDPKHSVVVGVLAVPADESTWSDRLRFYFKAIYQYHARPKETPLGDVMVTNLSSFPSALTVIPVPEGDIRAHRQAFIVNENLKRLGCSGRSGMTLSDPTPATQAKFYQLYKTSEKVPFVQSVVELVKLCQVSLFMFGKLDNEYIDGLLCDKTEESIGNWWTELGAESYNVEPTDGILGPTTVAALLGMLMGARNRLHYYGAPVSKDVFDIESTKRGIAYFQKSNKIERTRRLDRQTILKLHKTTAKAAAGEGWGVQKAVKSTVAEIGGKRGELVIGMVSGKDKAGIADIETVDIDKFITLAYGERAKWLWYGKPRRTVPELQEKPSDIAPPLFGKDEISVQAGKRTQSLPLDEELHRQKEESPAIYSSPAPASALSVADSPGDKEALRKGVFKSVAGRVSDAKSGLGRIKDVVGTGLRGHASRPSRDDFGENGYNTAGIPALGQTSGALSSPVMVGRAFTWKNKPEEYLAQFKRESDAAQAIPESSEEAIKAPVPATLARESSDPSSTHVDGDFATPPNGPIKDDAERVQTSVAGSVVDEALLHGPFELERSGNTAACYLQRRHSINVSRLRYKHPMNEARWPRRLSFGDAEEAVLRWDEITEVYDDKHFATADALQQQASLAEFARSLYDSIATIKREFSPWVESKVKAVEGLDEHYAHEQEELQNLYYQYSEAYHRIKQSSSELIAEERAHITEAIKEVEVLVARLEYEISGLVSKVDDVEDGVRLFERQVEDVEKQAEELKKTLETESWAHWFVRTLTGIGTGPNITRGS
ncbi:Protein STB2 [Colletotrichum orbiculare MAFF 240422]|uniref:Protein STB2 n=1 Tax=Colletotrichum orbiculare (strain 104-T / ATCC 96160 / CBS 514.97 / LARS 414 / MAFF 240422) TaxID=1213857 RepID=N4V8V6_COLOR|nr:Protein STB2 [Colletotrichum orbiculare MAFF 240422]